MHTTLLTKLELSHAIETRLALPREVADEKAEYLLDIFGFHDQVIDNVLEPEDRQLFYTLQESGLLTTRSEETPLPNGQDWRTHYWLLREDRILAASAEASTARAEASASASLDVYADLPAECWSRK